jgi:hypothetical protein
MRASESSSSSLSRSRQLRTLLEKPLTVHLLKTTRSKVASWRTKSKYYFSPYIRLFQPYGQAPFFSTSCAAKCDGCPSQIKILKLILPADKQPGTRGGVSKPKRKTVAEHALRNRTNPFASVVRESTLTIPSLIGSIHCWLTCAPTASLPLWSMIWSFHSGTLPDACGFHRANTARTNPKSGHCDFRPSAHFLSCLRPLAVISVEAPP